ncbi:DUF2726 domain-containing protein (plasmid) [Polymorphobacter sp. PAMC 29334]|uniref:DUF2726 domain-containing protein n=1 Tax=Polymorphobacter sp. PAMC 29334 TaxID=2862331 RepID=UPI001C775F6F|nr:DUF2726 domain-containing protein [Polymorphobacter sp. PAMC 29334]QYE37197.1 DUF2726 domain-containing protein [Polymorphobacter sp. PAMC 29334]
MTDLHSVGSIIARSMLNLLQPVIVIAVVVLVILVVVRIASNSHDHLRIERKRLLTPTEVRFWRLLVAAVPDHAVFSQVAMGAMLKPVSGLSRSDWWSNYGRYSQKVVDFVVVDPQTGEVVAVVELDDRSHNVDKDAARDALMACGGYDVVRISVNDRFDARSLRARLFGDVTSNVRAIGPARLAR